MSVHVVTADGHRSHRRPPAAPAPLAATGSERLDAALAGRRSESPMLQMPWDGEPLVIAEPVLVDGEVRAPSSPSRPPPRCTSASWRRGR